MKYQIRRVPRLDDDGTWLAVHEDSRFRAYFPDDDEGLRKAKRYIELRKQEDASEPDVIYEE